MPERSANISTHDPFGSLLGYAPGGIAIYSSDYHTADEKEYPFRNRNETYTLYW